MWVPSPPPNSQVGKLHPEVVAAVVGPAEVIWVIGTVSGMTGRAPAGGGMPPAGGGGISTAVPGGAPSMPLLLELPPVTR